ncbi:MAG: hypothetical protein U1F43_23785 [Myxococcota bacterium]
MNVPTPLASATRRRALLPAMALLLGLAACGDEKVIAIGGDDTAVGDSAAPDTSTNPDTDQPPVGGREIIVLHDTTQALNVPVTQNQLLRVKVVDYGSSGPAADASVHFSIVTRGDGGDASLSAESAYTDASGIAAVTFRSNQKADVAYTVEVTSPDADPVRFDLYVADSPRGNLTVNLAYEGAIAVKNVHVRLVSGQFTCSQFNAVRPPEDVIADKTVLGVGQGEVSWPNLPDAQRFTVFATAEAQNGHLAAAGCLDGVVVVAHQTNTVTLSLYVLTLNPTGLYNSTTVFDFTGAIPGQLGDLVDEISTLFTSPGTFLIDRIKDLAALYVGEFISDAVFSLFESTVADVIDDWMFNNSPQWVQDILTVGQDLFQVVNNLEMQARLTISKLQSNYYVQGALDWTGIVLYWHYGCAEQGQPGYDANCGRHVFSLTDFQNTEFPMDIVQGRFTASIEDFDQLDIDNHTIKINYGKLIIFVLNEMILPQLTGEDNLSDAILSFVNCPAIADGIYFSALSGIGISEEDIANFCTSAINIIVNPVEIILSSLALDSQLRMSGHAVLSDDDNDLYVDHILQGTFLGHFESDGQEGSPFHGVWSADKVTNP